ncbi:MAG: GNAT family N-acetyltransferase [Chloroflexi bacterium]|nr:GNAT family N-acetyltransferase [Chloroflexota bacterium]
MTRRKGEANTVSFRTGLYKFVAASEYSLRQLAGVVTSAFKGYEHPVIESPARLARLIRVQQIDLDQSLVACDLSGAAVGIGFLGVRGRHAWVSAFGIIPEHRGRGVAQQLLSSLIQRAGRMGCADVRLEVLAANAVAQHIYGKAGFAVARELLTYERSPWNSAPRLPGDYVFQDIDPAEAYCRALVFPGPELCWQRDWPAVFTASTRSTVVTLDGHTVGCVFSSAGDNFVALNHVVADCDHALGVIASSVRELGGQTGRWSGRYLTLLNEPAGTPIARACEDLGFRRTLQQLEMRVSLTGFNERQ